MSSNGVQVLVPTENHTFKLNTDALDKLLMQENIKDRYVCVVSVAGAFRTGKSFLLDFFIRYLKQTYEKHSVTQDWLGDENEKLLGFSWRSGSKRETIGIIMWSDIFLYDDPNGDKIAIILLDAQGTFDNESTLMESATVFGISTMISSVMIYNIKNQFDESYLQHLHLFTEYGRLAMKTSSEKPFQNLLFLVRDWNFPDEAAFGSEGGEKTLNNYLKISDTQPPELQTVRHHIKSCFTKVNCFLLPHPGKVVGLKKFEGCLKDLEEDFKQSLCNFVPSILAPENLVSKTINGNRIYVKDLLTYLEAYVSVFNSDELPQPKTVLMATAEVNYRTAINIAKKMYNDEMNDIRSGQTCHLSAIELEARHLEASLQALNHFNKQKKMCGDDFFNKYRSYLVDDLKEMHNSIEERNEEKKQNAALYLQVAVNNAHEIYVKDMRKVCDAKKPHLEAENLQAHHLSAMEKALDELNFDLETKAAGSELCQKYCHDLNDKIYKTYEDIKEFNADFKKLNEDKSNASTITMFDVLKSALEISGQVFGGFLNYRLLRGLTNLR